ncbi:DUF4393 domain-containing protein [Spirosoma agri]|uniref:DUF4393 domain-containing protein n=1 Tax=Spirosoma agri TaxID=1987381 RepID=A0A6M0IMW1_9BACT|nr:DUF4393 domain-containing protein [Spirosoma agri]NEU68263.1 DUF4393 domain-containing protein [Spirosoma agri]
MADEDSNGGGIVKGTIEAATGLVQAVPIYNDLAQPALQEVGKGLGNAAKIIHVALAPITGIVWGYEKISDWLTSTLEKKLSNTPPENIVTPDPHVVGPAVESLRFTGHNETLAEMYANLIANAMDRDTVQLAHPSFVEIIKNLTSDEGLIINIFGETDKKPLVDIRVKRGDNPGYLNYYDNYSHINMEANVKVPDLLPNYLNNLCRLGILEIPYGQKLNDISEYDRLTGSEEYNLLIGVLGSNYTASAYNKLIRLTDFGIQFKQACLSGKGNELVGG